MARGCTFHCMKNALVVFNTFFWLIGAALLGVGIYVHLRKEDYDALVGSSLLGTTTYIIIGVGAFIFIIGFTGCCGAVNESKCLLSTYFTLLCLTTVTAIAAGVTAYVMRSQAKSLMLDKVNQTIQNYYGYEDYHAVTLTVSAMQQTLKCCGIENYTEWRTTDFYTDPTTAAMRNNTAVPSSCCKKPYDRTCNEGYPIPNDLTKIYAEQGCLNALMVFIQANLMIIGGIGFGVIAVMVTGMVMACCMCRTISIDD